jgi:hypothetical protein
MSQPKQLPMVRWYDPTQLIRTAIDVATSTVFGRHSDFRLVEALAASPIGVEREYEDVGAGESLWIDYVADLGDGWNSTYAVACALAQPALILKDDRGNSHETKRGSLLVFGGDEVYPVASRTAYQQRLVAPYQTALRTTLAPHPSVYAIPGNHDWYDSLVSFTRLFCSRSWFAGWQAKQTRSYFAAKLPRGWWLIGTDVQLDSDLDDPQIEYFKSVAAQMNPEDRVILCNAEPHWIYAQIYGQSDSDYNENNLAFLESKVLNRKVAVLLAGDLHHYRRHEAADGTQKITAGGGGAFLHPTHGPDVSTLANGDFKLKQCFPDAKTSRGLAWRNLLFPFLNPWFATVPGVLYVLAAWSLGTDLTRYGLGQFREALGVACNAVLGSPVAAFWVVLVFLAIWLFTDTHSSRYRLVAGTVHGLVHLLAVFLIGWGATRLAVSLGLPFGDTPQRLLSGVSILVAGGVAGSLILGVYLLVSINIFGRHANEAFSSLAIEDWKSFLRMKIDPQGNLTIYPVGIRRVPRKWKAREGGVGPELISADPRATGPELIESPVLVRK